MSKIHCTPQAKLSKKSHTLLHPQTDRLVLHLYTSPWSDDLSSTHFPAPCRGKRTPVEVRRDFLEPSGPVALALFSCRHLRGGLGKTPACNLQEPLPVCVDSTELDGGMLQPRRRQLLKEHAAVLVFSFYSKAGPSALSAALWLPMYVPTQTKKERAIQVRLTWVAASPAHHLPS